MIPIASPLNFTANKMPEKQAKYMDYKLSKADNVDIICHDMTDRDSANSALAMWEYMSAKGINARIILSENMPEALNLRNYNCNIVQDKDKKEISSVKPDIIFCVDFGSKQRVSPDVLRHISETPIVMGIDHHSEVDIARESFVQLKNSTNSENIKLRKKVNFYSDMSAKSTTSVIYRFFEALGEKLNNERAYDLFFGLVDDGTKRNLIKCDGEKGTIEPKKALIEDKNAYEIYTHLRKQLNDEQISYIAKSVDIISSLTPEQQAFKDSLKERMQFSKNGKIVYIEIPAFSEEWEKLGGDNTITSTILNRFRQEILADEKYSKVEAVICFYEANNNYRLSAHSKNKNLLDFFQYVNDNAIDGFKDNSGGHPMRAGGSVPLINSLISKAWMDKILSCDKFFEE